MTAPKTSCGSGVERHGYKDSVHLEWVDGGELMRCKCGEVWIRVVKAKKAIVEGKTNG